MSSTDCTDICDLIVGIMCKPCPHYIKCQNMENEANHDQMSYCLQQGTMENDHYVDENEVTPMEDDE